MGAYHRLAKALFEAAMLKRLKRTGYAYLGTGSESVAEHSFGVVFCAWLLASLVPEANSDKVIRMAILHDLAEARIGDLNSVNKLYDQVDEVRAFREALSGLPFEKEALALIEEYLAQESLEARLAHDADQLDLMVMLKEQRDLGNPYAPRWLAYAKRRLKTEEGRRLAEALLETDWASWWLDQFVSQDEKA
ncbi:HD domain-containing protein [Thermosulfurimonas marina]|uniref:5'-deoxynucleotidase n=1 Tax=Thermosulfurimonas marina TaxID=2047767 RepID=A0A6H1WQA6_9BACT|nr:HD domain-containing protein [Thermosulfurimonas marina]QJA05371.1 HD domain-containing protein [Thermosulfurimonas marina]